MSGPQAPLPWSVPRFSPCLQCAGEGTQTAGSSSCLSVFSTSEPSAGTSPDAHSCLGFPKNPGVSCPTHSVCVDGPALHTPEAFIAAQCKSWCAQPLMLHKVRAGAAEEFTTDFTPGATFDSGQICSPVTTGYVYVQTSCSTFAYSTALNVSNSLRP